MEIDWKKVKARFKKLKTVEKYRKAMQDKSAYLWTPLHIPFDDFAYGFFMSDRTRGKTTQFLLIFMIAGYDYNKTIEYVRTTDEEAAPKNTRKMFDVILTFDYVKEVTKGMYNSVTYQARYWYYCNVVDGKITDTAPTPFLHISDVRHYLDLKSGYNSANSDLVLYDEFIGKEQPDDFISFTQLQSTYFRMRKNCKTIFLANSVNKQAPFFYEFTIAKPLEHMQSGENKIVQSPLGTKFYIEILPSDKSDTKAKINTEYYGFANSKLASITGAATWAFKQYKHIDRNVKKEIITKNVYIQYLGKYYRCDICHYEDHKTPVIECHRATKTYDDSIIFTMDNVTDGRYIHALGYTRSHKKFWLTYRANEWYFDDNETGDVIERYYTAARRVV